MAVHLASQGHRNCSCEEIPVLFAAGNPRNPPMFEQLVIVASPRLGQHMTSRWGRLITSEFLFTWHASRVDCICSAKQLENMGCMRCACSSHRCLSPLLLL